MRLICAISVFLIFGSLHLGGELPNGVNVFWIPSEVETYIPVTPKNIEKAAFKIVYVKNEKQATQLVGLIQKSNQVVDTKRIRTENRGQTGRSLRRPFPPVLLISIDIW